MDNFFINQKPYEARKAGTVVNYINKTLRRLRLNYQVRPSPHPIKGMNTLEQRINFFHLLETVIATDIKGDVVELGCFTGHCAMLFQKTIQMLQSNKKLHLYDSFSWRSTTERSVVEELIANFDQANLHIPQIHAGYFDQTIPKELPESISFAHIDCGVGENPLLHKNIVHLCLEGIYPRMSNGAICVLMDYHAKELNEQVLDVNPGVKLACDEFLTGKEEKIISLFGNQFSHAFFRKIKH